MTKSRTVCLLAVILVCTGCASPEARQGTAEITGFYEGVARGGDFGELAVTLDLREEDGAITGVLLTPLGDFPVEGDPRGESASPAGVFALRFRAADGDEGTLSVRWEEDGLRGGWRLAGEGGELELRRVGPSRGIDAHEEGPDLDIETAAWRADVRHLAAELVRLHGNAFHTVASEQFTAAVEELEPALPALAPHEIVAAMGRLVALVGDGHTFLELPESFRRFPVELFWFGDTLRVVRASPEHAELLGAAVVGIGSMDLSEADRRMRRQLAAAENEQYVLRNGAYFLTLAELLHANGITGSVTEAEWVLEGVDGERRTVRLEAAAQGGEAGWVSAAPAEALHRRRPGEDLWQTVHPGSATLYVNFRGYPPADQFDGFFEEVFRIAEGDTVERLVIDLRSNSGGDFTKARESLLPRLRGHRLNHPDRLFVLIGRGTFSAAMTNAADLANETRATLVGEPTGARPNGWQENRTFRLPNSGLRVSYSTRYYRFLDQDLPAVMPDERIDPTWDAYREGRDRAMEWVESRPLPDSDRR